jgi:hypothetical protein
MKALRNGNVDNPQDERAAFFRIQKVIDVKIFCRVDIG